MDTISVYDINSSYTFINVVTAEYNMQSNLKDLFNHILNYISRRFRNPLDVKQKLRKFIIINCNSRLLHSINNKPKTNYNIYNLIDTYCIKNFTKYNDDSDNRPTNRMNDITYILNTTNNKHITRVLDVGCGNGDITKEYAKTLKIEPSNVCGIDILDYENTNNQFIYKKFNGCNIPYENNSFDLVVCFVMIHHVAADKIGLINDIKRVLKPNGILIIREHDVTTTKDIIYLDLIHEVNDFILYDKNIRTNTEFYRMYLSKEKLHSILSPELELIYYKMYTGNNPQKLYYAVYRRSKN